MTAGCDSIIETLTVGSVPPAATVNMGPGNREMNKEKREERERRKEGKGERGDGASKNESYASIDSGLTILSFIKYEGQFHSREWVVEFFRLTCKSIWPFGTS